MDINHHLRITIQIRNFLSPALRYFVVRDHKRASL